MVSRVNSVGLAGLEGFAVEVEADIHRAEKLEIDIIGLPDASVKEAKDRVRAAAQNSGYKLMNWSVVLNLAPANVRKEGSSFDLAIVLAVLISSGQIPPVDERSAFVGELSLSGQLRPCAGVLASVISARELGFSRIFVPRANAAEGAVIDGIEVYGADDLKQLIAHLNGSAVMQPCRTDVEGFVRASEERLEDFSDVVGQQSARRACEIAAAGGHNMLFIGPPGAGKSMLAKRLPSILPDMTFGEMIESSKIYSIAGKLSAEQPLVCERPFVRTNQSVSVVGMTGGGAMPGPGLISLAHNGVLFLDEVAEFNPKVLDSLRQPLEDDCVTISRVRKTLTYPASFMLVCAMNPCPCGRFGHPTLRCICTPQQIERYMGRISGPLLDRIDLQVELPPVPVSELRHSGTAECSASIRERVNRARRRQQERYRGTGVSCNAKMTPAMIRQRRNSAVTPEALNLLNDIFTKLSLSMRAYDKIIKISQTIADLSDEDVITADHVAEAVYFRSLDKKYWSL